jgi:hypothetical protein
MEPLDPLDRLGELPGDVLCRVLQVAEGSMSERAISSDTTRVTSSSAAIPASHRTVWRLAEDSTERLVASRCAANSRSTRRSLFTRSVMAANQVRSSCSPVPIALRSAGLPDSPARSILAIRLASGPLMLAW